MAMDPLIVTALVGGAAGLVTGLASALGTPWAQWGVEKRRKKLEHRTAKLKQWKSGLNDIDSALIKYRTWSEGNVLYDPSDPFETAEEDFRRALDIDARPWFLSLRHYLSDRKSTDLSELVTRTQSTPTVENANELIRKIASEILTVEKQWEIG